MTAQLFGKESAGPNFGIIFLGYGVCSLIGLAVLPRLSARLEPLNYILGGIALSAALSVYLLGRCYKTPPLPRRSSSSMGGNIN